LPRNQKMVKNQYPKLLPSFSLSFHEPSEKYICWKLGWNWKEESKELELGDSGACRKSRPYVESSDRAWAEPMIHGTRDWAHQTWQDSRHEC
jgi:hypothetical protein